MHEYGGDILYALAQALAKNQFSFKVFFTKQLGHGHSSATTAIILHT